MLKERLIQLIEDHVPDGAEIVIQDAMYKNAGEIYRPRSISIVNVGKPIEGQKYRIITFTKTNGN